MPEEFVEATDSKVRETDAKRGAMRGDSNPDRVMNGTAKDAS